MLRRIFSRNTRATPDVIQLNPDPDQRIHQKEENEDDEEKEDDQTAIQTNTTETENYDDLSFIIDYIGTDYVSEAQSVPLLMETLKRIKKQHSKTVRVDLVLKSGILKVTDIEQGGLLITAPLYAIALCAQEQLRGFETTFAVNITRRRIHMCHVFQAGSILETASIVRSIALSFRSVAKDLKELRYDTLHSERARTDSESSSSRYRTRAESDTGREFDTIARRHGNRVGVLSTVRSEENIGDGSADEKRIEVMLHQTAEGYSSTQSTIGDRVLISEDEHGSEHSKNMNEDDTSQDKFFVADRNDLFIKALQALESQDKNLLLKYFDDGLPLDAIDKHRLTLLHYAVVHNKNDILEMLLEKGADVDKEGKRDQTPLHYAAAQGNRAITKLLLAHGANVRAKDCQFRTPLHLCAGNLQNLEVSYVLVEHGARIEDNDIEGVRPVDLHLELREMQNRLIQSACDAFVAADLSRSRSNSGNSSTGSFKSAKSPNIPRRGRLFRSGSLRLKASPSLHSIQDVGDVNTDNPFRIPEDNNTAGRIKNHQSINDPITDDAITTDSEVEKLIRKEHSVEEHEEYDDDNDLKHMREIIDHKVSLPTNRLQIPASFTRLFKKDPATDALHLLVTLSGNPECQSTILANLCLPKPSNQLVSLAHSSNSTIINLQQISKLLHNLFTVSGPSGRQKCISTGLLKTVVDLLDATEPIQGTCLSILNDLLHTENERDYSGTMSGIPIEPLLTIVKSIDHQPLEVENVREKTKLKSTKSIDSGYTGSILSDFTGSLKKKRRDDTDSVKSHSFGRGSTKPIVNKAHDSLMLDSMGRGRVRSESLSSVTDNRETQFLNGRTSGKSSDTDSKEGLVERKIRRISRGSNSSVDGSSQMAIKSQSSVVARHIAMKMLTASSRNVKLQEQLAKPNILNLLSQCLADPDDEIILQSATTVANIALNVETHDKLKTENIQDGLYQLLKHNNIRIKYQAARGLIYLGHNVDDIYIFDMFREEETNQKTTIYTEDGGCTYIKGTTIENLVYVLTTDVTLLWSGANITPPSPNERKPKTRGISSKLRGNSIPVESQIINFVLSTFQTFVHPIIFMRILLHRFREPTIYKRFLEVGNVPYVDSLAGTPTSPHMEHYAPLPVLHARLMRIWIAWLDNHSINFVSYPELCSALSNLIPAMREIDGPYAPCATKLESLLGKISDGSDHGSLYRCEADGHHNVLYEQCNRAIRDGKLPCSDDDYLFLAALQLYIEDLKQYGHDFTNYRHLPDCQENINTTRIKTHVSHIVLTIKQHVKKIRQHYETFFLKQPTERNAKHSYVDCCQGMDGYGCTFFKVKQRIPSTRSKKRVYIARYLGISSKRIVVLDERSKICVEKFISKELRGWKPIEDNLTIKMLMKTKAIDKQLEFHVEPRIQFKELTNQILTCTMEINFQGYQNIDTNPWSRVAEQCGTWGNMALQRHILDKPKTEDPVGEQVDMTRTRSPTALEISRTLNRSESLPHPYSRSAPVRQDSSWNTSETAAGIFFNLKGRFRSRADTIVMSTSPQDNTTNSLLKDLSPDDSTGVLSLSLQSSSSLVEPRCVTRRVSSLAPVPEKAPMLEDSSGGDRSGDLSPTDCTKHASGKILTCHCPPDADLSYLNLREFSAFELLCHPRELARQITLIDHELFCAITSTDVLLKISLGLIRKHHNLESQKTVEMFADRFNKLSNWIVFCIVSESNIHRRATMFTNFIETAKQCLELRNYNAVMAIVVASLGSIHVRRLAATKELVSPEHLNSLSKMESLLDSKSNYKKYREALRTSPTPAVPYFGIFLKDFTFISDGNPDYLKGGVINLSKRRQVFMLLEDIRRFQRKRYNFQEVPEIKDYFRNKQPVTEEQLQQMSKGLEPNYAPRSHSISQPSGVPIIPSNGLFRHNSSGKIIVRHKSDTSYL